MTREEAYIWNENSHDLRFTGEIEDMQESIHYLLKKCFNSFEKQLEQKDKQIAGLIRGQELLEEACDMTICQLMNEKDKEIEELKKCCHEQDKEK